MSWLLVGGLLSLLGCKGQPYNNMDLTEENFFDPAYQPLAKAIRKGNITIIDHLLANGLEVNHVGKENMSFIMWAIVNQNKKSLMYLLKKGANPNYKDAQGSQPVGFAVSLADMDYLKILLDHGGDPNSEIRGGRKALLTTIYNLAKDRMYLLLDKGADINARDISDQDPAVNVLAELNQFEDVAKFLERGVNYQLKSETGGTLAFEVQDSTPDKGTDLYEWQKKVRQMLVDRGIKFPVPHPFYVRKGMLPIRDRWYQTPEGHEWQVRMDALGKDPEGFGEKWRKVYAGQDAALQAWMVKQGIPLPSIID